MREIDRIIAGLGDRLGDNPKLSGVIRTLQDANNLNDSVGGPSSVFFYEQDKVMAWNQKLIDFFSKHAPFVSAERIDKNNIARLFNEEFVEDLTDTRPFIDLFIPDESREKKIDQAFKSSHNRMVGAIRRVLGRAYNLDDEWATIGRFRDMSDTEIMRLSKIHDAGVGKGTLVFMRTALAQSPVRE